MLIHCIIAVNERFIYLGVRIRNEVQLVFL